jgi:hypothetical protein
MRADVAQAFGKDRPRQFVCEVCKFDSDNLLEALSHVEKHDESDEYVSRLCEIVWWHESNPPRALTAA